MRKIIVIVMLMTYTFGFSQEKTKVSNFFNTSRFDILIKIDKVRFRFDKDFKNLKYPIRSELSFKYTRTELFVGTMFPLDETIFLTTEVGLRYEYQEDLWNPLLKVSLRARFRWGIVRIDYNSHWVDEHRVSSSMMFNVIGPLLRVGVASRNQYFGPRAEARMKIGKKKKTIRFHASYFIEEQRFDYGLRLRFGEWFPKIDKKLKQIEKDMNNFLKKSE